MFRRWRFLVQLRMKSQGLNIPYFVTPGRIKNSAKNGAGTGLSLQRRMLKTRHNILSDVVVSWLTIQRESNRPVPASIWQYFPSSVKSQATLKISYRDVQVLNARTTIDRKSLGVIGLFGSE